MATKKTEPKRGRPRGEPTKNTGGARFPADVLFLLDEEVARIKATTPGGTASRTTVLIGLVRASLPRTTGGAR